MKWHPKSEGLGAVFSLSTPFLDAELAAVVPQPMISSAPSFLATFTNISLLSFVFQSMMAVYVKTLVYVPQREQK